MSSDASGRKRRLLDAPGAWLAIAAPVILFNAHLLFGAMQTRTALAMNVAMSVVLAVALVQPKLRKDLQATRGLLVPGVQIGRAHV